jgi:hypothetical protein
LRVRPADFETVISRNPLAQSRAIAAPFEGVLREVVFVDIGDIYRVLHILGSSRYHGAMDLAGWLDFLGLYPEFDVLRHLIDSIFSQVCVVRDVKVIA